MWCVAELSDEYIAKIEDVLETHEKPYDPAERVVRSPSCCIRMSVPPRRPNRAGKRGGITSTNGAQPMSSAL
jgi:hypothetical protein